MNYGKIWALKASASQPINVQVFLTFSIPGETYEDHFNKDQDQMLKTFINDEEHSCHIHSHITVLR